MSAISDLMKQRQETLAQKEKREAEELQTFLGQVTALVSEAMGGFDQEIHPHSEPYEAYGSQREMPHLPNTLSWKIQHPEFGEFYVVAEVKLAVSIEPDDERVSPVLVSVQFQPHARLHGRSSAVSISHIEGVADFFIGREKAVREAKAEARNKRIEGLKWAFVPHPSVNTPENMFWAAKELCELEPENAAAYQLKLAQWQEKYDAWQLEETDRVEAEQARRAVNRALGEACDRYAGALRAWDAERDQIIATNRVKLAALQAKYDEPFDLWQMSYALSGRDEEGVPMVGLETAWVLKGKPDANGYWPVWDQRDQKVVPTQFFTATYLEYLGVVRPTETQCHLSLTPTALSRLDALQLNPAWWNSRLSVQVEVDAAMLPVPPLPDAAAFGLSEDRGMNVRDSVFG